VRNLVLLVWGRVFDPAMPSKARLDFRRRRHKAEFHHRESFYYKRREAAFVTESYKVGENCSFAPLGLESFVRTSDFPRLTPWAVFLRRFAARNR